MKQIKKLQIGEKDYQIISEKFVLELSTPGRGIVVVRSDATLSGIAKLFLGWNGVYRLYLTGYIESCQQMDDKQQRLLIRELPAALENRLPLSMRHVTAKDILKAVSERIGLSFSLEKSEWRQTIIPTVINTGTGFDLLDFLGDELRIKNYVWQIQSDGSIWLGSWNNSPLSAKINLPAEYITQMSAVGGSLIAIPQLRPGVRLAVGNSQPVIIDKIELEAETMRLNWSRNPFL